MPLDAIEHAVASGCSEVTFPTARFHPRPPAWPWPSAVANCASRSTHSGAHSTRWSVKPGRRKRL